MGLSAAPLLALAALLAAAPPAPAADGPALRGAYLLRAAGCVACHTSGDGDFLAGGVAFETPFGTFYSPNITPGPVHGIGGWTAADFRAALREGIAPDGAHYYPVFPYTAYAGMGERDVADLWAYLRTVTPSPAVSPPHHRPWYVPRWVLWGWKALYFEPEPFRTDSKRSARWNRGAYLATVLGHCGECHTPRNALGAPDPDRYLAGTREGPGGKSVPNITPDRETGIGAWDGDDLTWYFEMGATPGGDYAGGAMAEVIDESLGHLTAADRRALAEYLLSVPPIRNRVRDEAPQEETGGDGFDY
jgi:mono/diheme cytochrome c family protein